jgi:hypothetical protein
VSELIGGVFLVITDDDAARVGKRTLSAMDDVPHGRCLFVLWEVNNGWCKSVPIESIVIQSVLGTPSERTSSEWLFYGTGAVRTYDSNGNRPKSTWMWVGCRREGDKAYRRKQAEALDARVIESSSIPVSHKVFTRDVANNLWHLQDRDCLRRIIGRLQSLTMWSDELALVHFSDRFEKWNHESMNCDEGLVPVAEKVTYVCEGIDLALPGKQRSKKDSLQEPLF